MKLGYGSSRWYFGAEMTKEFGSRYFMPAFDFHDRNVLKAFLKAMESHVTEGVELFPTFFNKLSIKVKCKYSNMHT